MNQNNDLPECPVEIALYFIGDKWKLLIVRELLHKTMRFGELKKSLSISQKVLTQNLKIMEQHGLIHRQAYAEIPPRVEYSLTNKGQSLKQLIDVLHHWGESIK